MSSWRLIFRRLSLFPSSGVDIIKVALRPSYEYMLLIVEPAS
jgi:hypothetical protein